MRMLRGLGKTILAALTAAGILSGLLCFYYILPLHTANPRGNTDYVWPAHSRWVKLTEGISWGRFDADGFNNPVVVENPDILMLGSSHLEGTSVMPRDNAAYLLGEGLRGRYTVYNMGISGHDLIKTCSYLPASLGLYDPAPRVAVLETHSLGISAQEVEKLFSGGIGFTVSHDRDLIGAVQRVPVLRCMYYQINQGLLKLFRATRSGKSSGQPFAPPEAPPPADREAWGRLLDHLAEQAERFGTKLVIVYHPPERLLEDGSVYYNHAADPAEVAELAAERGVTFVDLTDNFRELLLRERHVAHGFVTGRLCAGHINKYGHRVMAEALERAIHELEKVGDLCK